MQVRSAVTQSEELAPRRKQHSNVFPFDTEYCEFWILELLEVWTHRRSRHGADCWISADDGKPGGCAE
jgi:hypothetical protein